MGVGVRSSRFGEAGGMVVDSEAPAIAMRVLRIAGVVERALWFGFDLEDDDHIPCGDGGESAAVEVVVEEGGCCSSRCVVR